jgi:protein-S-isoprenylcysteine O-methyltransferase Ste14
MANPPGESNRDPRWSSILKVWKVTMGVVFLAGPFLAAGTLRCPPIWLYLATILSGAIVQHIYVSRRNPEIHARRRNVGVGTKRWDIPWSLVFGALTPLAPVLAGLGVRFGWATLPAPCAALGVLANTTAGVVWARAMATNAYFESTVRIQHEHGHGVVDGGPYRFVRHPGYSSFFFGSLGAPLMLLSWPALATGPIIAAWILARTVLEDATLRRELPGYDDYARRVRFRLVPGVW